MTRSALHEANEIYTRLGMQLFHCEQLLAIPSPLMDSLGTANPERSLTLATQEVQFLFVRLEDIWSEYMMCQPSELNLIFGKVILNMKNAMDHFEGLRILHMTC